MTARIRELANPPVGGFWGSEDLLQQAAPQRKKNARALLATGR
ncbi:hypothetical protein RISK_000812 [Rhodopirellula islandica]|uniref:Uncharacterized protein n=1 Tax=Rhodopirellula islandica TaxID=595434 RepID=A0A0J1BKF0_RHOIS|nr:hypothetical protein RISK_000812 [Rhodopirellula islandica]